MLEVGSFVGGFLAAAGARGMGRARRRSRRGGRGVLSDARARRSSAGRSRRARCAPASVDARRRRGTRSTRSRRPRPTLAAAARAVRAGGLLALRVPNGRYFADAIARLGHDGELRRRYRLLALAWNNLIGFPYLHGYSVRTLDRLVAPYGFERVAAESDTLLPLADADTRPWAALEERVVKAACRVGVEPPDPGPARVVGGAVARRLLPLAQRLARAEAPHVPLVAWRSARGADLGHDLAVLRIRQRDASVGLRCRALGGALAPARSRSYAPAREPTVVA